MSNGDQKVEKTQKKAGELIDRIEEAQDGVAKSQKLLTNVEKKTQDAHNIAADLKKDEADK